MRLKTIFIIVITILLTIVIMQNNAPVTFKVLFFSFYTSKLMMMLWVALAAFIIGYLVGRPKVKKFSNDYGHGYDERDENTHEGLNQPQKNTLSDEDRDYISED
ncbi:hypothetical protein [Mucilaginibacter boryungensis]|uniref:Integral membrane protein n=1 Tax=Mucilaginibacter boryungensis TaxID=768480 RepID=A0ABR9XHN4_9SPHI|nr:hypothetical protein [Mucilaginibacter boryungensis]MBE9666725.1 hypothetical protein [Mucilaginibacter boryungensis]